MKTVVIIGAGPAGLTAAYTLLTAKAPLQVILLEEEQQVGGISKTVSYHGNKMDLGGHRFFSKSEDIHQLWQEILPLQKSPKNEKGPDPMQEENVFLIRNRLSRIYYHQKFFDYPVQLNFKTIHNLGLKTTISSAGSYLKSCVFPKKETNLENFYINRFGKKLYQIFFEGYTEKLWGRSPKEIDASWGKQRVKGLSIKILLRNALETMGLVKRKTEETSLIQHFYYPKYGPGQMWEEMAKKIEQLGGVILFQHKVIQIKQKQKKIVSVTCEFQGQKKEIKGDIFLSSMPLKDFIAACQRVPKNIQAIASHLPYRDFITLGLLVKKRNKQKDLKDCWIYIQGKEEQLGRIQIFNNWSPFLLQDEEKTLSLGLEYFCNENDAFWNKSEEEWVHDATEELLQMGLLEDKTDVLDFHLEKVKKAYPAYFDSYQDFPLLKAYLETIPNLYCIGRNGQHRYNNMDHSMETGIRAAKHILNPHFSKEEIWNVNMEESYHEVKE